ncbi:pyrimidine reductase [Streptomyces bathyalis]|uniref:Pyrimidine reductase n=1 Tax=Streptomyces bathyalis TaxID=2710756 RepID=A0A7T1WQB0_9ACTN|nr:dihydrofolate reductase family protein [Streptomyces bathyalis]QPP05079.1 pyrimidine reductase [Streptomyces bathyalis]
MPTAELRTMGRPHVVAHLAVSLDGATTGFEPDIGLFYELAGAWQEDVTLAGADTILAQEELLGSIAGPGPAPDGPLLAVVDGRGRVRRWSELRDAGHWSDVLALHCPSTSPRPAGREVRELVTGAERVDLREVLRSLGEDEGAHVVRVDSGGALTGALIEAGLLDELSLLVHPVLAGPQGGHVWHGGARPSGAALELVANESLRDGIVRLRYHLNG